MFSLWMIAGIASWAYMANSFPIPQEMVDMTYTFDNLTLHWPTVKKFEIVVKMNETVDEGYWLQMEEYSSSIHVGTHMDAPCHFAKGRWGVDEVPIEHLIAPAAVIDIVQKAEMDRDALVTIEDLQNWERMSGQSLNGTIVMILSGWGRRWSEGREAFTGSPNLDNSTLHFPGISKEAAQWLVDKRRIYGLGTDALSLDNGPSKDFMAHRILLGANIYGLENVANMEDIPLVGATLHVLPMKIGKGSGAPVRIIATFPKVMHRNKDGKSENWRTFSLTRHDL